MPRRQSGDDELRSALADYLQRRRRELELRQAEAARRAGVRRMTWYEWEAGRRLPQDASYRGLDDAMQWRRGHGIEEILAGREPEALEEAEHQHAPPSA